jgi:hypothetical protein
VVCDTVCSNGQMICMETEAQTEIRSVEPKGTECVYYSSLSTSLFLSLHFSVSLIRLFNSDSTDLIINARALSLSI